MGVRSGKDYIAGLAAHPREVWVGGRKVTDVTADPVFRRPIAAIAALYDLQCAPERAETMSYALDDRRRAGMAFLVPRTRADLARRRGAIAAWADASFGMVGRSPDYLDTVLMAWVESSDFFAAAGPSFATNVGAYYRRVRDGDLFLTHAIVNPQVDRSKPVSEQHDPFAYLGVVEERRDGLVVRGAKMLATHGPTADELLVYPLPGTLRPGEERYALAFAIPCDAPGLKFICREPFDRGEDSMWDHPVSARFEEPDAVAIFDDVLIPWERVFLHGDVGKANGLFPQANIQNHTAHQTAIRGLAKCRFIAALAVAMARTVKTDAYLHVQEQLGEILGYLPLIEGAILLSEEKAETTGHGTVRPAWAPLQSLRYHIPRFYERIVQVTQLIGAGSLLVSPSEADLRSEVGPDIARYYRGAGVEAADKIHLFKLAWDATGTQFGQRSLQYERYYAGDPTRIGATLYQKYEIEPLMAEIARALAGGA
jgi:4-hydroxyphenylacetate 3-monooxygenase oxygenase component